MNKATRQKKVETMAGNILIQMFSDSNYWGQFHGEAKRHIDIAFEYAEEFYKEVDNRKRTL